ncbi:MAG: PQQ-dependent sugar dehydrogenase, partial [Candidatus Limnocylindrales bacterium]
MRARRRTHGAAFALVAALALILPPTPASAAITLTPVITGLTSPVYVTGAGDGSGRLFVVEQTGRIKVFNDGASLGTFLNISTKISKGGERGLLGLAFHPNYETNRKFYVYFTLKDGDIGINEYKRSASNANRADLTTRRRLLTINHPASNHNGGMLAFGRDGYLYIGVGDGGGSGDAANNAQNKDRLLGKILRIDINGRTASRPYRIPSSNPFVGKPGRNEIWSYGLRNPWKFSFDRVRGDIWVGDVGQNRYEEINRKLITSTAAPNGRGSNYGWRVLEGWHCFRPATGCNKSSKVRPIVEYSHAGGNCSVTGGYVYRGPSAALVGKYIFADYCSGRIWSVPRGASAPAAKTLL